MSKNFHTFLIVFKTHTNPPPLHQSYYWDRNSCISLQLLLHNNRSKITPSNIQGFSLYASILYDSYIFNTYKTLTTLY